jgi:hypothetical protein
MTAKAALSGIGHSKHRIYGDEGGKDMRYAVFTILGLSLASSPVYTKCHYDLFRAYYDGATSTSEGTADSGKACAIHLSGKITSIEVTKQAQHGTAAWTGSLAEDRVIYTSKAGYKDPDTFTIAVHGVRKGYEGVSYQTLNLDVQ